MLLHFLVQGRTLVVLHGINEEAIIAQGGQGTWQQPRQPAMQREIVHKARTVEYKIRKLETFLSHNHEQCRSSDTAQCGVPGRFPQQAMMRSWKGGMEYRETEWSGASNKKTQYLREEFALISVRWFDRNINYSAVIFELITDNYLLDYGLLLEKDNVKHFLHRW